MNNRDKMVKLEKRMTEQTVQQKPVISHQAVETLLWPQEQEVVEQAATALKPFQFKRWSEEQITYTLDLMTPYLSRKHDHVFSCPNCKSDLQFGEFEDWRVLYDTDEKVDAKYIQDIMATTPCGCDVATLDVERTWIRFSKDLKNLAKHYQQHAFTYKATQDQVKVTIMKSAAFTNQCPKNMRGICNCSACRGDNDQTPDIVCNGCGEEATIDMEHMELIEADHDHCDCCGKDYDLYHFYKNVAEEILAFNTIIEKKFTTILD